MVEEIEVVETLPVPIIEVGKEDPPQPVVLNNDEKDTKIITQPQVVKVDTSWCTKKGIWVFTKSGTLRMCDPKKKIAMQTIACVGKEKTPTFPWLFKVQKLVATPIKSKSGVVLYNSIYFFKGLTISGVSKVSKSPCSNGSVLIPLAQSKILFDFAGRERPLIWVSNK